MPTGSDEIASPTEAAEGPSRRYTSGPLREGIALGAAVLWRWRHEPKLIAALLGRYGAHLAILVLALLLGVLSWSELALTPLREAEGSSPAPTQAAPPAADEGLVTSSLSSRDRGLRAVVRHANPLTNIPERQRLTTITYTVQSDDTLFDIAEAFRLAPTTLVWSNIETLQGAPWLLQPGLPLIIPPVDGAYHTVKADESWEEIADAYGVEVTVLHNPWNATQPGEPLTEGTLLIIPGGRGSDFEWTPPAPQASGSGQVAASWTYSGDAVVYPARGWFALPTGSHAVSGYVFGDRRNPYHRGLDYACSLGAPIYAADAGRISYAGWGGGYGNLIQIDHGNGFVTYYAHLSTFAVGNRQPVAQGQVIGYCGSTGISTGAHLHYEIRLNGVPQNPRSYEP